MVAVVRRFVMIVDKLCYQSVVQKPFLCMILYFFRSGPPGHPPQLELS